MNLLARFLPVIGPACIVIVGLLLSTIGWSMPAFVSPDLQAVVAKQFWFGPDLHAGAHNSGLFKAGLLLTGAGLVYGFIEYRLSNPRRRPDSSS